MLVCCLSQSDIEDDGDVTVIATIVEDRLVSRGKMIRGEELHHAGLLPIINNFVTR